MAYRNAMLHALFTVIAFVAQTGIAASCPPEQYFAPDDHDNASPLSSPHREFQRTRVLAQRGIAAEERNLAAFYESGYLVTRCPQKAASWYEKAATHGDMLAKDWLERNAGIARLRTSGECFADSCFAAPAVTQKTVPLPNANGGYTATVTINGRSVRGIVDTGATFVSLSAKTATELGLVYAAGKRVQLTTANGVTTGRAVVLERVTVGNISLSDVAAVVAEADYPLLIGMSFLRRLEITTDGASMTLVKR